MVADQSEGEAAVFARHLSIDALDHNPVQAIHHSDNYEDAHANDATRDPDNAGRDPSINEAAVLVPILQMLMD